ncbi:alpha/beta family hydrolase [Gilvimarinus sp. DA14]|uniref:alpha/beta family hydrolase n=1 Tax=Gilvimarinus sp. DA14 TaxID=2956798 RepID=UPI0020B7FD59|nr:alpha/beta family hydrolase [Gilvimarinus sp. DA14]UTF61383.1 alpha/beta hydrolase [Gilvimarinus sp. DA14]
MAELDLLLERAAPAAPVLALAHGAGAPMDSEFMNQFSSALLAAGVSVCRFEFPYMQERRRSGKKRPPDRQPVLLDAWHTVLDKLANERVFIGGKSMGGRMAATLNNERQQAGVICLGYPFHPPAKPDKLRLEPLQKPGSPVLIIQGSRDKLGCRDEVAGYSLAPNVSIHWLEDGDHDLKPRVKSGFTHQAHIQTAAHLSANFMLTGEGL